MDTTNIQYCNFNSINIICVDILLGILSNLDLFKFVITTFVNIINVTGDILYKNSPSQVR